MLPEVFPPSASRVKKQIEGRDHVFALVLPPGLEELATKEAQELGLTRLEANKGDASIFEFAGRMAQLYRASTQLRLAGRILLRVADFHASAREELFRQLYKIPWELWLRPGLLRVDAHIKTSRISHEGMASQTTSEAIMRRWLAAGLTDVDQSIQHRIIIRLEDNRALVSIDASGQGLYHRGWRIEQAQAPLRENLAAGILKAAGWPERVSALLDPMCGSGTFSIEAWGIKHGLAAPSDRKWAFFDWPVFTPKTFAYHSRSQESKLPDFCKVQAMWTSDQDANLVEKAKRNFQRYASPGALDAPVFSCADFFEIDPHALRSSLPANEKRAPLLVLNPPYGLRLESGDNRFFERLYQELVSRFTGWRVAVLALSHQAPPAAIKRFRPVLKLRHGGLDTSVWFLQL